MGKLKKIVLFLSFCLFYAISYTQVDCGSKLKQARELFESGQIEQIPELLDSCINKGFDKDEQYQAYRLLIQTYLFDYNRDKAMEVMYKFLTKYPGYKYNASDPVEIKEIYDSYIVRPRWGFGISVGANLFQVTPIQYYSVYNLNEFQSDYSAKLSYNAGVHVERYIGSQLNFSLGFEYLKMNYENKETAPDNLSLIRFTENSTFFRIPLTINYNIGNKKFSPFVFGGASINLLQNSTGEYSNQIMPGNNIMITQNGTQNIKETRKSSYYSIFGGLGLQYKYQSSHLRFWVGYDYSVSNDFINRNKRYQNVDNILKYNHIDDDIRLNHYFINLSYSWLFYKVKIKKANGEN